MERAIAALHENEPHENKLEVVAIASPLLKCSLDEWKTQSQHVDRVFDIANLAGARIVRVFSGSRVAELVPLSNASSIFFRILQIRPAIAV